MLKHDCEIFFFVLVYLFSNVLLAQQRPFRKYTPRDIFGPLESECDSIHHGCRIGTNEGICKLENDNSVTTFSHPFAQYRCNSSDDNHTGFYLLSGNKILVSKPLKDYEELLEPFGFFRVHQSHLINLNHMQQFDKREGGYVIMRNGDKIPVSSRKRDALINILEAL